MELVRDILRSGTLLKQEAKWSKPESEDITPDYQLERSLLKSKIETLKLYARWLGPYLRQARQAKQNNDGGAGMVNLFNTATATVTLLAQRDYDVAEDVHRGELPKMFLNSHRREIYSVLVLEWKLRGAPERGPHGAYVYRGRFDLVLTSYALREDEITRLCQELDHLNLNEVIHAVGEASASTLTDLVKVVDSLVAPPKPTEVVASDPNPFTALFDFSDWFATVENTSADSTAAGSLRPDSEIEQVIRSQALLEARRRCHEFYNRTKQSLKMPTL